MGEWKLRKAKKKYNKSDDIQTKLGKVYGVRNLDSFLHPKREDMYDPYKLKNIQEVAYRILDALTNKKMISISMDIDADGLTSTAILYNYLRQFTDKVQSFHVQRSDGHGIENALEMGVIPKDTELLVILDSSTSSTDACRQINEKFGLEPLIVDHHIVERKNPYALIVNPQLDDYPNKEISGAGLTWKLISVIDDSLCSDTADDFLDLAAVGMNADMMSMREPENRAIVYHGLENIKNKGLLAILKRKSKDPRWDKITAGDIGFTIAPNLNGAARMEKIELALELLTSDDDLRVKKLAKQLEDLNEERKELQAKFAKELLKDVKEEDSIAIIRSDEIGKGFGGLVAQDIVSHVKKPVLMLSKTEEGDYSGSFRTFGSLELKSYLSKLPQVKFTAGHEGAGGATVDGTRLKEFITEANTGLKDINFGDRDTYYDIEVSKDDIDEKFVKDVMEFTRISGKGMYEAKFLVRDLFIGYVSLLGKKKNTVKIECDKLVLMKFRTDEEFFEAVPIFENVDAIGSLNLNKFYHGGVKRFIFTKQMFLEDYRVSKSEEENK